MEKDAKCVVTDIPSLASDFIYLHKLGLLLGMLLMKWTVLAKTVKLLRQTVEFVLLRQYQLVYSCLFLDVCSDTECNNGGFPNPEQCTECVCPDGYGGPTCDVIGPINADCKSYASYLRYFVSLTLDIGAF